MNQAETLCHSSGPWKKHKYISKVGEGAKAVYKYAKDKSGATDRENWQKHKREADMYEDQVRSHQGQEDVPWHTPIDNKDKPGEIAQARGARQTEKEYKKRYDKTPLGKAESTATKTANSAKKSAAKVKSLTADSVQRGQEKIKKLFSSETKVTHKSNVTSGKSSTSKKVKYNSDGTKVTVTNTFYPKKKK